MALVSGVLVGLNLIGAIAGVLKLVGSLVESIISYIFKKTMLIVGMVIVVVKTFYDWMTGLISSMLTKVTDIENAAGEFNSEGLFDTALSALEKANYVFPVDVMLALLVALMTLWLVATSYRFVKSWIPTLT